MAQSAAGSGNGSSCANAKAYSWNWSGVTAGDTVWVCGTISGQLPAITTSGTSGNPVTLKFCSGASDCGAGTTGKFSAPYIPQANGAFFIQCWGAQYVVIDGNGVGIIEATNNGTQLAYQYGGSGVYNSCSNVEIKNLTIQNLFVHVFNVSGGSNGTIGIYNLNGNNVKVHDNTVIDSSSGILFVNGGSTTLTGLEMYNNTTKHTCWGMGTGTTAVTGSYIDGAKIHDNEIEVTGNWMTSGGTDCHNNGFYNWSSGTGTTFGVTNMQIYNNYVHGSFSSPGGSYASTAGIGFDGYGIQSGLEVYNNLLVAGPYWAAMNGLISISHDGAVPAQIYNNTIADYSNQVPCINMDGSDTVKNNICMNAWTGIYFTNGHTPTSDYNDFYNCTYVAESNSGGSLYASYTRLSDWQSYSGGDAHSITTNPALNSDYTEQSSSPTGGAGANLTSLGITALNSDKAGVARPSSGAWDIGAYQYGTGSGSVYIGYSNGGCLIATAAFGSNLDHHVAVLRDFRDKYLLTKPIGKTFVNIYYSGSPPIADFISKHEMVKTAARSVLTPVIYCIEYPYLMTLFLLIPAGLVVVARKKIQNLIN